MPTAPIEPPPAPLPDPDARTLLVTLNGPDRPGVTKALFEAASTVGADVLDLEQVVVRGHLALSVLPSPGRDAMEIVPPWRSAISRQIPRPRPDPERSSPADTPLPVSATSKRQRSPCR